MQNQERCVTSDYVNSFAYVLMDPIRSSVYNVCMSSPVVVTSVQQLNTTTKNTDCKYMHYRLEWIVMAKK